ncbi:C-C motif chemokine 27a [Xiphias gladius]|uniref:C-C motif chemokine 27a n=1 Tax=Xiphias gladius TaxID=8245 RepID=UPI001A998BA1|nr:C-C motif chemokine 27a [Xiphias gladius]
MDPKVAFVIACVCALVITSTEAGIPKCCIKTRKKISHRVLMQVERSYVQLNSGACDISALVLYLKGTKSPICVDLKLKTFVDRIPLRVRHRQLKTAL